MRKLNWRLTSMFTVVGCAAITSGANSAGFQIKETNSTLVGQAMAGSAATTNDFTTMFNNPASLAHITKHEVALAGNVIIPNMKFQNSGSSALGAPLNGGNGGNAGGAVFVPAAYLAWNFNQNLKLGLGVTSPWGLKTEWDNGWVGRYHALKSELKTVNINPAFGYKFDEKFSLGAGMQIQYADAELTRATNIGAGIPPIFGAFNQLRDGTVKLTGHDWAVGWNVGAMYNILKHTRLGLAYRSQVAHKINGNVAFTIPSGVPAPVLAALANPANPNNLISQKATTRITTPESITLSGVHEFNEKWSAMADITYMNWARFKELRVSFPSTSRSNDVTTHRWRSTMFYSLGANWKALDNLTVRAGIAYDQTPVRGELRHPSVPDANRTWLSAGLTWKALENLNIGLNYAHIFVSNGSSTLRPTGTDAIKGNLLGSYKSHVDVIGAQVNWKF